MPVTPADWDAIKSEYITTKITYPAIVEKYGVKLHTLQNHSRREGWKQLREEYQKTLFKKTTEKYAAKVAKENAEKLYALRVASDKLSTFIDKMLDDEDQFFRYIVTTGLGGGETSVTEEIFSKVDTKAVRDIAASLKEMTAVVRNLNDIPTTLERAAMENAAQRLQLDVRKAELADTSDASIVVEFDAAAEEYSQ